MGQSISRRLARGLDKTMQRHRQAMDQEARKEAQKPSGRETDLFKRQDPQNLHPKELEQQAFLRAMHGDKEVPREMPPDLIKFLQDMGPVESKVEKDLSSLNTKKQDTTEVRSRTKRRRSLPLIGQEQVNEEAFTTTRTTDFSTRQESEENVAIGWTDNELFLLFRRLTEENESSQVAVAKEEVKARTSQMSSTEQQEKITLVCNALKYTSNPTLMQDTDSTFVGAWRHNVGALKLLKLRVPTTTPRLYLDQTTTPIANKN